MIGTIISHYRIVEKIGAGGMGEVYRAHDEQLDRDVALKILPAGLLADETARKQFRKEALALAKLNHPNIETVYEFGSQDGVDFLAMELIPGQSLSARIKEGPLAEREIVRLGTQLADGLAAAHDQGVIHRDLKPGNLFVTPDGRLKILDFGLARLIHPELANDVTRSITVESGTISGTVPYMPPEQLRGEPTDARSDIYSAGAVFYEMAAGQRPFPQTQGPQLMGAILHKSPEPLSATGSHVSPGTESVILKALEKEASQRYQTARELRVALEGISSGASASAVVIAPAAAPTAPADERRIRWPVRWPLIAGVIASAVALIAAGAYLYFHRAPKLTEKDTVVLADFDNKTGDPVFDDALKQALAVQLGQSPFLNILSGRKVEETLALMGRPATERIARDVARELCVRTGSKAILLGSISKLGSQYVIGVDAVGCTTGDALATEQEEASTKEDVLKALSRAATSLRGKLGESLASVQKFDVHIEATTKSLEALKAYSMGSATARTKGDAEAIPLYKRALELDPNFALAYASLGIEYFNLGQASLAGENIKKAYALRDRVSEREKYGIEALYYDVSLGDEEQAIQVFQLYANSYPQDAGPPVHLGAIYGMLGQYEKAVNETQDSLRLEANSVTCYGNLAQYALALNRPNDAKMALEEAEQHKLEGEYLHQEIYYFASFQGDVAEMERQVAWAAGKPGAEDLFLSAQSDTQAYSGRLGAARDFSRRAVDSAIRNDSKESAALWQVNAALREAEFSNSALAKQDVAAALALAPGRDVKLLAALALARAGDTARAKTIVEELEKEYSSDTILKVYWLPTIKASVELNANNPAQAVELLRVAAPYEFGEPPQLQVGTMYPVYIRGQAQLMAHNGAAAATEFHKYLEHRGVTLNYPLGALAHLGLARAYALQGDTEKARATYNDFFTLWKEADSDIPILKQARAEYAKLK